MRRAVRAVGRLSLAERHPSAFHLLLADPRFGGAAARARGMPQGRRRHVVYRARCRGAAILGLLLCADKEAALLFCFLGYYPLLKPKIDAISSKVLRLLLKVALCTVSMGLMYALIIFVFKLPAVVQEFSETAAWLLWVTAATGLALFFLYDIAIDRLSFLYRRRRGKKA